MTVNETPQCDNNVNSDAASKITPPPLPKYYASDWNRFPQLSKDELAQMRKMLLPRTVVLAVGVMLAVMADWFFWDQPCGWTLGLFTLLLGTAAYIGAPQKQMVKIPAILTVVSAAALITQLSFWGVLLAFFSIISMVTVSRAGQLKSVREWLFVVGAFFRQNIGQAFGDMVCTGLAKYDQISQQKRSRIAKQLLFVILFAAVFIMLFLMANPILAKHAATMIDKIKQWMGDWIILHVIFWLAVFLVGWICMRFCMRPLDDRYRLPVNLPTFAGDFTVKCLWVFNAVFLLQTGTDAFYLWSGVALPEGMTYAEYAQRGAYPLAVAAILAGAFMVFAWGDDREKFKPTPTKYVLAVIWLAQNVFLMVCAARRLYLYVSAYSMTYQRFFAGLGMILIAIGFLTIAVRVIKGRNSNWLLTVNAASITIAVIFCAFFNTPGWIAEFNVNHSREICGDGTNLDIDYVADLGPAALPALCRFAELSKDKDAALRAGELAMSGQSSLESEMLNWRYRTLRRSAVFKYLQSRDIICMAEQDSSAED